MARIMLVIQSPDEFADQDIEFLATLMEGMHRNGITDPWAIGKDGVYVRGQGGENLPTRWYLGWHFGTE